MPQAGRVGDKAIHGSSGPAVEGEVSQGSPDVLINGRAALRVAEPGEGSSAGAWRASRGSTGVFINGKPAFRSGDETLHVGGKGQLVEGSPDVFLGDMKPGAGARRKRPHDKVVAVTVKDALGRPIKDATVQAFCPHHAHPAKQIKGSTAIAGLCSDAKVTMQKALQVGAWDAGASLKVADPAMLKTLSSNGTGGAPYIEAPAPAETPNGGGSVPIPAPDGTADVRLTTVHNWVELIFEAFGQRLPTRPGRLALLGVREASLRAALPETTVEEAEKDAATGNLEEVTFTREKRASPTYNDLLIAVWTDTKVNTRQHVEVFECTIDAHPGEGELRLPFLLEGKVFHAKPGPFKKAYPGKRVALHVSPGKKKKAKPTGPTAEKVLAVARKEIGQTEHPPGSNRQKYGAWYGFNGVFWCAEFVSWVFAHAGVPAIHYAHCNVGAANFRNGAWGTWHGPSSRAKPGDIVIFDWDRNGDYDHTAIIVDDDGHWMTTIEGNTSPSSTSGSQSNGDGVYLKKRDRFGVVGFGRPKLQASGPPPLRSFIRWGGEGERLHGKSMYHSTLLHHRYFKKDPSGRNRPDPKAARYRRFMKIYNAAVNKKDIPYLIVSSRYIKTYSEWAAWVLANPAEKPGPRSVVRESGLVAPKGLGGRYLPSFIGPKYAERVLARAAAMSDKKKAAKLRAELKKALLKLAI